MCEVYACIGGIFGTVSIVTMVVIGYDRYNVIVKGFKGTKITTCKALIILAVVWIYGVLGCMPPFWGWGGYKLGKYTLVLKTLKTLFECFLFQRDFS